MRVIVESPTERMARGSGRKGFIYFDAARASGGSNSGAQRGENLLNYKVKGSQLCLFCSKVNSLEVVSAGPC